MFCFSEKERCLVLKKKEKLSLFGNENLKTQYKGKIWEKIWEKNKVINLGYTNIAINFIINIEK